MLTLHIFGPAFGLPDPSPFVIKAMMLLKLAGLDYATRRSDVRKAPKRKLPVLDDAGTLVPDSTFIRMHLERTRGVDFDAGFAPRERAVAWSVEKLLEDHLYWLAVHDRWMDDGNSERGPAKFFQSVPMPMRQVVKIMIRRKVRRNLWGQGAGRYDASERAALAERAIGAIADLLGDRRYLLGDRPCGADATLFAFVAAALAPGLEGPFHDATAGRANLVAYRDRMMAAYFPES